jgi:hypothetical protein
MPPCLPNFHTHRSARCRPASNAATPALPPPGTAFSDVSYPTTRHGTATTVRGGYPSESGAVSVGGSSVVAAARRLATAGGVRAALHDLLGKCDRSDARLRRLGNIVASLGRCCSWQCDDDCCSCSARCTA